MVDLKELKDRVSAHEALHQFFGWHGTKPEADEGIMDVDEVLTAMTTVLTDGQIKIIQKTDYPA